MKTNLPSFYTATMLMFASCVPWKPGSMFTKQSSWIRSSLPASLIVPKHFKWVSAFQISTSIWIEILIITAIILFVGSSSEVKNNLLSLPSSFWKWNFYHGHTKKITLWISVSGNRMNKKMYPAFWENKLPMNFVCSMVICKKIQLNRAVQ